MVDRLKADCSFYLAANMHWEPHEFDLPALDCGEKLQFLFSTNEECVTPVADKTYTVPPRSLVVFAGVPVEEKKPARMTEKKSIMSEKKKSQRTAGTKKETKVKKEVESKKVTDNGENIE